MSKENTNLRLLGSPVNLSYRSKKKDDKKNVRNRPRSALQSTCFTPDYHERFKRPFSADTKEHAPSTRSFLKSFSEDVLQSYNNAQSNVKVVPPTADLLGDSKKYENTKKLGNKDFCSNASDYGSEDTFMSLGTKIKTKAQSPAKNKNTNIKALKYRNIAKRGRRTDNPTSDDKTNQNYGLEITITERPRSQSPCKEKDVFYHRSSSPMLAHKAFESYFVPFDDENKCNTETRSILKSDKVSNDIENAIDTYSRRLMLTKQQLSLVEEESTQDNDSIRSNNMPSMSIETALKYKSKNIQGNGEVDNIYTRRGSDEYARKNYNNESKTYRDFYDDINSNIGNLFEINLCSPAIHTDSSSKDSGYPESTTKEERAYTHNYSLPSTTTLLKKSNSDNKLTEQPKSLDSTGGYDNDYHKTYPLDKKGTEPLNHSRLLYKDFFIKKEGHIALPPNNSPVNTAIDACKQSKGLNPEIDSDKNLDYPTYLLNSTTKAYTTKVIEDYKKEIEAINNLHELTLKDIKTESISPTPLNIDAMFETSTNIFDDKQDSIECSQKSSEDSVNDQNSPDNNKTDISKVTTKELIQNYFKVKRDCPKGTKDTIIKNLKKFEKKINNFKADEKFNNKIDQKNIKINSEKHDQINVKQQWPKNIFTTKIPLSARIECVQNDKDVDSWMSLTVQSPKTTETDHKENRIESGSLASSSTDNKSIEDEKLPNNITPPEAPKVKDLDDKSTVLDIYSMLKKIEGYGDNPVAAVENLDEKIKSEEQIEKPSTPKDNFMEIFEFLEKVEQSASEALSVVTKTTPQTTPKLEVLLKLPHTELAQRVVTASLQLEERSCCIALLQESLANHKQQMISKVTNLEKQSHRNVMKVKQECEETIKRHQNFIDQLINDKKTLNHRIEQLVDERRSLEERWKRSAQSMEERYKLELRNQHDKMAAAQQVARQRWVRQKAEKIKELTVKGLEGELREMAERQQKEISDLKMAHAEQMGKMQAKHNCEMEELRRILEQEKEDALIKERHLASSRMEKQILEMELSYQEQRTRLVAELRAENERAAEQLGEREREYKANMERWKEEQERILEEKRRQFEKEMTAEKAKIEELLNAKRSQLEEEFEGHRGELEAEQQIALKKKLTEISAQHKLERDREIEKAIESMEAEAQNGRKELQEALRRNKEQYEAELKELAETERATLRRYQEAQARVRQTEDRCAELEVSVGHLETRNKVLTERNIQLESRLDEIRKCCEEEWRTKMVALEKQMADANQTHEEQMHQLYAKVKVAVARKDSAIQALTRESAKYQEKITLLEQKLQQQRRDFLKQK